MDGQPQLDEDGVVHPGQQLAHREHEKLPSAGPMVRSKLVLIDPFGPEPCRDARARTTSAPGPAAPVVAARSVGRSTDRHVWRLLKVEPQHMSRHCDVVQVLWGQSQWDTEPV